MAKQLKPATGSVQEKNNTWYACINYTDIETGKRKMKMKKIERKKLRNSAYGITKSAAKTRLNEMLADENKNINELQEQYNKYDKMSAGDILLEKKKNKDFYQAVIDYIHENRANIKPSTYESYLSLANGKIRDYFKGKYKVKDIRTIIINDFYSFCTNRGLKNNSIKRYSSLLRLVLNDAIGENETTVNPVERARHLKIDMFKIKPYSVDEARELIKKSREENDSLSIVVTLSLIYGFRRSEIIGLKWSSIDFEENTIKLDTSIVEVSNDSEIKNCRGVVKTYKKSNRHMIVELSDLKTESSKTILPLLDVAKEELLKQKEWIALNKKIFGNSYDKRFEDFVCVRNDGFLLCPSFVSSHYPILLKKTKCRSIRFHDLRHTTGTLLMNDGIGVKQIQQWLRHSDASTTAKYYLHTDMDNAKSTGQKIEHMSLVDENHNDDKRIEEMKKLIK